MLEYTEWEGIHLNTFHLLFGKHVVATIDMQLSQGLIQADMFTYYRHSLLREFFRCLIMNRVMYPNIIKRGHKEYAYSSQEEQFDFVLLNKYFNSLFKDVPEVKKKLFENYKKAGRAGTCQYSIILACCLIDSKLVIGNMPLKNDQKVLHRFVEVDRNNQQYVLDIAKNLIMKKDDYYRISKFEELGSIESLELRAIYNFALETGICSHTGIISMFGQEILNDLEKNKLLKKNYNLPNFHSLMKED